MGVAQAYTVTTTLPSNLTCQYGTAQEVRVDGYYREEICGGGYACPGGVELDGGRNKPVGSVFRVDSYYDGLRYFDGGSGLLQPVPSGVVMNHPLWEHSNVFYPWYVDYTRFEDDDHLFTVSYSECVGGGEVADVPEFSTIAMGAVGVVGLGLVALRKK